MQKFTIIILAFFFGCQNFTTSKKEKLTQNTRTEENISVIDENLDFNKHLTKEIQNPLKRLNRKQITELKTETLRIWRFPGGGAVFEQMLEYKKSTSEITFHSYLIEEYINRTEFSMVNYSKKIEEKEIKNELDIIFSSPNFIKTKNSENYCESPWSCSDVYLVEYTTGKESTNFIIQSGIDKCENKEAEYSKILFKNINLVIDKYSS